MTLEDPLAEYRLALPDAWRRADVERLAGELLIRQWTRGGSFVAMSTRRVYIEHEKALLAIPRKEIEALGVHRVSSIRKLRWGLGLYLVSLLPLVFELPEVSILLAVAGGVLATQGFLAKALVFQLRDKRIPPLLVPQTGWKAIGKAIETMK